MCLQEFMYRQKRRPESDSASVTQLEGDRAFTPGVAGSTPAGGTEFEVAREAILEEYDEAFRLLARM